MNSRYVIVTPILLLWVCAIFSQTTDVPRFEVASIKQMQRYVK